MASQALVLLALPALAESFALPRIFEGIWQGIPYASVLGPWSHNFTFSITRSVKGDYLLQANLPFDASPEFRQYWSWQRSYLKGSGQDEGRLLHCPGPRSPKLERVAMMQSHLLTEHEVTFCLRRWPGYVDAQHPFPFSTLDCYTSGSLDGCGCFKWTLRVDQAGNKLDYQVSMAASPGATHSKHMWASLQRLPDVAPIHLTFPGNGRDFDCDYKVRDEQQTELASCPFALKYQPLPPTLRTFVSESSFQHCYVLDEASGLTLQWNLNLQEAELHLQLSALADVGYVSIGFRPLGGSSSTVARDAGTGREQRFGMAGADIVLGRMGGIKQFYASSYSGAPEPDDTLPISRAAVTLANGRLSMEFTRPLVGGKLTQLGINASILSDSFDMMWALGRWDDFTNTPTYHGASRGWREVNWENPDLDSRPLLSLRPYRCASGIVLP
eukprot:TRINITY_DN96206_c0_g1_i1.p1 TRINITY_DN96206_c0_g1~~TRINITY_DN96206_c0_g1_i1.p1  ORF type:complete len:442 (+),score=58.57 TRINITY_DN96206_c0_g1_i1:65-1390(+)